MGQIYIALNQVNGKAYIGQSIYEIDRRRRAHERAAVKGLRHPFYNAIRKYGPDAFEWSILKDDLEPDELDLYEIAYIRKYNTKSPNGYNMTAGGKRGDKTDDAKEKNRQATLAQWANAETRAARLASMRTPEVSAKISEVSKRSWASKDRRDKAERPYENKYGEERAADIRRRQSGALIGITRSDETKERARKSAKARVQRMPESIDGLRRWNQQRAENGISDELRQKLIDSHTGKVMSDVTKARMREAQRRRRQREREAREGVCITQ